MKSMDLQKLHVLKEKRESFYIYFSAPGCGVCGALQPKLTAFMKEKFPKLKAYEINTSEQADVPAQLGLYTNPSLLVFLDGNEILRRSRAIGLDEVERSITRYYHMFFE